MEYCLAAYLTGSKIEISIDEDRFNNIKSAREKLISALAIEEKYDLLFSNYMDLEKECLSYAMESMVQNFLDYDGYAKARQDVNRRVVNLLTSTRLYVDHIPQNIDPFISNETIKKDEVKRLFSIEYDKNFSYRFMEALRNYVQHCGLAIHSISTPSRWTSHEGNGELEFGFNVFSTKESLSSSGTFKKKVLSDMPEKVEILRSARSYIGSLSRIHAAIRSMISEPVKDAREKFEAAIQDYQDSNSHSATGLQAHRYDYSDGIKEYLESYPIFLEWDESRLYLENKNKLITNLEQRFVSNGAHNKAVHENS